MEGASGLGSPPRKGSAVIGPHAVAGSGSDRQSASGMEREVVYACSIGGLGTWVGTPTNALLTAFVLETHGVPVTFAGWLAVGLPCIVVGLAVVYLILSCTSY